MDDMVFEFQQVADLTTNGFGVDADAHPLVAHRPRIHRAVPGRLWTGTVGEPAPSSACPTNRSGTAS